MQRLLLAAAALLAAWAVVVAATGGVDARVAGVAIRSRDPFRAAIAAVALFVFVSLWYRTESAYLMGRLGAVLRRHGAAFALAAAAALFAHGVVFGSFGVGGSDSYCYVNQAYDWAEGRMFRPLPIAHTLPFETSDLLQQPLGYRVAGPPHTIAPICAPGLSLLMAIALVAGASGPYLVVPIFAVLFVWFTFSLGRQAAGSAAGVAAAIVLIVSPVVLFQALWPMSDIPAGALWTGAIACALKPSRRSVVSAGLCAALGILVRPNLALLAAAPLLAIVVRTRGRARWIDAALFTAPIAAVVVFVAAINTSWFGSPGSTGYGAAADLYAASNVWPNLKLYASWLWESQSPWVLLAILPFVPPFARHVQRGPIAVCALLAALALASYASYTQFGAWWYLRFLLPGFGALAVLIAAGLVSIARVMPRPLGHVAAAVALYATILATLGYASRQFVFGGLRAGERRYIVAGEFAADQLPANAAIFAMQHSGSLRFYSGRLTLRYDWVQPQWAAAVPEAVEHAGFHPYLMVDDWELADVRKQFGLAPGAALPWPVFARTAELSGMTVFDLASKPGPPSAVPLQPVTRRWYAPRHGPI